MLTIFTLIFRVLGGLLLTALAAVGLYQILPLKTEVKVPFTTQAPEGVWSEPWQSACEEASIIMIDNFYRGDILSKEQAKAELLKIFNIKENKFGPSSDESMGQVAVLINSSNLNWRAAVKGLPTIDDLKKELAGNRPIIAPVYAPALNNPYYAGQGPDYHVVVMIGYDDTTAEFITHDPGTAQGKNFRYPYQVFYDAISDYLDDPKSADGPTRVIFTSPKN